MSQHSAGRASQASFSRVNSIPPQRSTIPISSTRKHLLNGGDLVPAYHQYCLPGDVWSLDIAMFARLLTLKFPLMDNLILDWFAFFDPDRIIWKNFEKQQGFQENVGDSTDYVFPWFTGPETVVWSIQTRDVGDYLGYPMGDIDSTVWKFRSTPMRAYRHIWNEWFRDQDYQDSLPLSGDELDPIGDGPDNYLITSQLLKRNKRPDYFRGARPQPQKGPDVPIPWDNEGLAPVVGNGSPMLFEHLDNGFNYSLTFPGSGTATSWNSITGDNSAAGLATLNSNVFADIGMISANINQLRESIVLQQIYELDARGGTRYTETLKNRWDVDAEDFRLQRPEYIAGGSSTFSVSQVAQTSPTAGDNPQASLAAYSEMRAVGHVSYRCVEHGHLFVLVNVRAPLTYQQNINRKHLVSSRFDSPEPLTMNLGERPVYNYEIFYPPANPETVWGYQPIWSEWMYDPSFVTGEFRSDHPNTLDPWHLALHYETEPFHNAGWVQDNPEIARVVFSSTQPQIKLDFLAKGVVARKMPANPNPGLMRF